ncbi:MAG: 4Fe-4S binding protein [Actinobacteria bacterium]|nr:4Fe-4S binding protein [Actinomycetota bacterium]
MSKPMWFVKIVKLGFPTRFITARLTKVPVIGKLMERWLFEGDSIIILPRENVVPVGEPVDTPENVLLPSKVVEHFIERANYHWIMNTCICRESMKCKDYPADLGCLFLGEAVLDINPKLGHLVTKEEALEHARRCREAGLYHLIGRNKLDSVWLGARPPSKLLTICNCCTCCCLWRIIPFVSDSISSGVTRMSGVEVRVTERCIGCGTCTEGVCLVDDIRLEGDHAVHGEACRGCGHCVEVCPEGAIEISIKDLDFVRHAIDRLSPLVDIS